MLKTKLISFYKRNPEVLGDMIKVAQNREIGYMFEDGTFGKRPYILENEGDIFELIKKGAVSFHMSVERWLNPLELSTKLKKTQLNELRLGWDLIIDLDSKNFNIARYTAKLIIDLLTGKEIHPIYIKYSGGKGFHIAVPWELFPKEVTVPKGDELIKEDTKNLFPELARTLASYIAYKIEEDLKKFIERNWDINEIINEYNLNILPEQLSPFHLIEIDTILISSRHLFRMPYSINEKTGRISIPIDPKDTDTFNPEIADIDYYVYEGIPFLTEEVDQEPRLEKLIYTAIKWEAVNKIEKERIRATQLKISVEEEVAKDLQRTKIKFKGKVPEKYFPPCIKNILNGIEDGRKRALFILINFLINLEWSWKEIEALLWKWNDKNPNPLRERYIEYQLQWHKEKYGKGLRYLPPNCSNAGYYKDMGVCNPDEICKLIKNPISYPLKRFKIERNKNLDTG